MDYVGNFKVNWTDPSRLELAVLKANWKVCVAHQAKVNIDGDPEAQVPFEFKPAINKLLERKFKNHYDRMAAEADSDGSCEDFSSEDSDGDKEENPEEDSETPPPRVSKKKKKPTVRSKALASIRLHGSKKAPKRPTKGSKHALPAFSDEEDLDEDLAPPQEEAQVTREV